MTVKKQFMEIRKSITKDILALKTLYLDTILNVNKADYSQEEIEDWASCGEPLERWQELFRTYTFWVCEIENQPVGFTSVNEEGFINSMFVQKDFLRMGIARRLLQTVEEYAKEHSITELNAHVSITALPFFQRSGFVILYEQLQQAKSLKLKNYKVRKDLKA